MRDFYEILGVDRNATDDELKRAYRTLARQYHPDANPDDAEAVERFKEVSVAYEALSDPEKRRRYDQFGPEGVAPGGAGGDPFGFGLNDLFDAFFGADGFGGGGNRRGGGPPRGPDAEVQMTLTLADVVFGGSQPLDLTIAVACEACEASGCAPGTHPEPCTNCGGSGEVRSVRRSILGQLVTSGPCSTCAGLGQVIPSPCDQCRGEGRVRGPAHVDVEVPVGIDDGQRLRLSGRGPAGPRGGEAGDLYVTVRVEPHPTLERHGDDLHTPLRIAMTQAALGAELSVATLDGEQQIVVPGGTQPGRVFTIAGLGAPSLRTGRRGSLYVHVEVEIPTKLSDEETELLEQFAAMHGDDVAPSRDGLFSRLRSAFQ